MFYHQHHSWQCSAESERVCRVSTETNSSERVWSTWGDLTGGRSGVGIEAGRELALCQSA